MGSGGLAEGAPGRAAQKTDRNDPICFSPCVYRARNLVERFLNKIKQCRRVATRCDKLAANYLSTRKSIWTPTRGAYEVVRQFLGHKTLKTTTRFYAGPDTRRAGRAHAELIRRL